MNVLCISKYWKQMGSTSRGCYRLSGSRAVIDGSQMLRITTDTKFHAKEITRHDFFPLPPTSEARP